MVTLKLLSEDDKEQFILDNQEAFNYGALEEFGLRDSHFEEEGEIISRKTIEQSIESGIAYRIYNDEKVVGGAVIKIDGEDGELELLFIKPSEHTKEIGQKAWSLIEENYPNVKRWETFTPYFETRNIHFYVNKCGFKIVEYFNKYHPIPEKYRFEDMDETDEEAQFDGMFRFEKWSY